jgi:hypothetical protein
MVHHASTTSLLIGGGNKMATESMLTTVDNPHDPFTEFDLWYAYDTQAGHHTCSLLARIVVTSDDLSDADQSLALEQAIDEIARENVSGVHRKVSRETSTSESG